MPSLLVFAPSLLFGFIALVFSALAYRGDRTGDREELVARNRSAPQLAAVAVVLCALSLLAGAGLFILQALPGD